MRVLIRLLTAAACIGVAACDQVALPSSGGCGDADTLAVVATILKDNAMKQAGDTDALEAIQRGFAGPVSLQVEAVRTVEKAPGVTRSTCAAQLRVTAPASVIQRYAGSDSQRNVLQAVGASVDGGSLVGTINYTAQPTDDRKQVYVEVSSGPQVLGRALWPFYGAGHVAFLAGATPDTAPPAPIAAAEQTREAEEQGDPCEATQLATTVGMLSCQQHKFGQADLALNAAYKAAMGTLPDDRKLALQTAQGAWLAARDPECQAEATADGMGGTAATLNFEGCRLERTAKRTAEIQGFK